MKQVFVGDKQVTLNLQGLRWIQKENRHPSHDTYGLRWQYKNAEGKTYYKSEEERDDFYQRIVSALTNDKSSDEGLGTFLLTGIIEANERLAIKYVTNRVFDSSNRNSNMAI